MSTFFNNNNNNLNREQEYDKLKKGFSDAMGKHWLIECKCGRRMIDVKDEGGVIIVVRELSKYGSAFRTYYFCPMHSDHPRQVLDDYEDELRQLEPGEEY